jgi:endonuclease/exonuclease/phosphatase family metal-dependent hydrolase
VWLREKESGAECIVINTHFPHEKHDPTRTECARVILQQLSVTISTNKDCSCVPHIVLGDFNCHASPQNEAYATFMENGYEDTFKIPYSSYDDIKALNTFHHFMGDQCPWNLGRIDWILFKNQPSLSLKDASSPHEQPTKSASTRIESRQNAQIIRDAEPPLYPSDHYPIVASLELHKC